jgi:hypothetical protein
MTEDEKVDHMVALAERAQRSDVARRLAHAMTTDALVTRIVGADNPNAKSIMQGMTQAAIIEAAEREVQQLTEDERESIGETVLEHLQVRIVAATRHAWTVADMLGYQPETLNEDGIAWLAALCSIPADARPHRAPDS